MPKRVLGNIKFCVTGRSVKPSVAQHFFLAKAFMRALLSGDGGGERRERIFHRKAPPNLFARKLTQAHDGNTAFTQIQGAAAGAPASGVLGRVSGPGPRQPAPVVEERATEGTRGE